MGLSLIPTEYCDSWFAGFLASPGGVDPVSVMFFPGDERGSVDAEITHESTGEVEVVKGVRSVSNVAEYLNARVAPDDFLSSVVEFHKTFGHPVAVKPERPNFSTQDRRIDMLLEEVNETEKAADEGTYEEYVDGLIDVLYIALGGLIEAAPEDVIRRAFWDVHRANMDKLGDDGSPIYREDGKVLKPDGWLGPNLSAVIKGAK